MYKLFENMRTYLQTLSAGDEINYDISALEHQVWMKSEIPFFVYVSEEATARRIGETFDSRLVGDTDQRMSLKYEEKIVTRISIQKPSLQNFYSNELSRKCRLYKSRYPKINIRENRDINTNQIAQIDVQAD